MPSRRMLLSWVLLATPFAPGCGGGGGEADTSLDPGTDALSDTMDADDPDGDPEGTDPGEETHFPEIAWEPCTLYTGGSGRAAECGLAEVPIDRDAPDGRTIDVFVKRIPATGESRGSLWLINGGMVSSGVDLEEAADEFFAGIAPDLDLYIPDHRGTGRSTRLECPALEDPLTAQVPIEDLTDCVTSLEAEWGDGIGEFTTTPAARDLDALLHASGVLAEPTFLYGISYGTAVVHRYLQIRPNDVDGVILEGLCLPGACTMSQVDGWIDAMAESFFDMCSEDAFCSDRLGPDPWATARLVMDSLEEGHCPEVVDAGLDRATLTRVFASILAYGGWSLRPAVPAIIGRIERCETPDVEALTIFASWALTPPSTLPPETTMASALTGYNVAFSELWQDPPPLQSDLESVFDTAVAASGASVSLGAARPLWPIPDPSPLAGSFAETDVPLLMIHGTLDFIPVTEVESAASHLDGEHQHFVAIPGAPHATLFAPTLAGPSCTGILMRQLLAEPTGVLDTSCTTEMAPIAFDRIPNTYALYLFGTTDIWGG